MIRGFVYRPRSEPHRLLEAAPGELVANPAPSPPWIVVDHSLISVIVTSWPGRLLVVDVVEQGSHENLRPDANYTRAVAVRVVEERDPAELFGPQGAAVVSVIERAQRLTLDEAHALAAGDHPDAARVNTAAWNAWLADEQRAESIHFGEDHTRTLLIPDRNRAGSPINGGFLVISSALRKRAIEISGDAALQLDDEGDECLVEPWSAALTSLLYAAMALGAPNLVPVEDRIHVLRAFTR